MRTDLTYERPTWHQQGRGFRLDVECFDERMRELDALCAADRGKPGPKPQRQEEPAPATTRQKKQRAKCAAPNCIRLAVHSGYCNRCYQRNRRRLTAQARG